MRPKAHLALTLVVGFACALVWARAKDPFRRVYFSSGHGAGQARGMVVLSKPVSRRPVVIYVGDAGQEAWSAGRRLRQLAEFGWSRV